MKAWPDLPIGIKNPISAQHNDVLFVGLGAIGADLYRLDLRNKMAGWQVCSPFPSFVPSDAAAASASDMVHCYDPKTDIWRRVSTKTPVGLLGATAFTLPDGRICILGGYNKNLFDGFSAKMAVIDKVRQPDLGAILCAGVLKIINGI